MDQYWELMRTKVCRKCLDGNGKGACLLPVHETCALDVYFPDLVSLVTDLNLGSYEAYVDALRKSICSQCKHQAADGGCAKRIHLECAVDRYYPLIIEVIEAAQQREGENLAASAAVQIT